MANSCRHHWVITARSLGIMPEYVAPGQLIAECNLCGAIGVIRQLTEEERSRARAANFNYPWPDPTRIEKVDNF